MISVMLIFLCPNGLVLNDPRGPFSSEAQTLSFLQDTYKDLPVKLFNYQSCALAGTLAFDPATKKLVEIKKVEYK